MKKLLIFLMTPVLLVVSCVDSLMDYNIDETNPVTASPEGLFSNALLELADNLTTPSVNVNVFRFWTEQWTTTTYTDEPNYNITTRNIPLNFWEPFYQEVLMDLNESRLYLEEETDGAEKDNKRAQLEIMNVYTWAEVVNTWGDVPYSEALNGSAIGTPVYDDAATIYNDLLSRLDAAILLIDVSNTGFTNADFIYGGDMEAWSKFAHSLKLRLAITLADVNPELARAAIESSATLAFESNGDNATFPYQSATPNNNPISDNLNPALTTRQDYVAASTMVNKMNELNDPRRPFYYTSINGTYVGGTPGTTNLYASTSTIATSIIAQDFPGLFMSYSEIEFILAEAAERWGIVGDAATHYENAIRASIGFWGGTDQEATTYLGQTAVAYATATGDYKEKIGVQKWISLFNTSTTAWTEWRRLDYPELVGGSAPVAPGIIPLRFTYPTSEQTLNNANMAAAAARLSNGDAVNSRIFWDIY